MMSTRALVRGRHTKKTGAFERACAAFVFITVPTIEAPLMRIKLNLLGAQVALANQLLPQVDALVMAAVTAVPEVLAEGEHAEAQGNLAVREANGREEALLEVLSSLCAFLVVVPGHPKSGPFYLAAGLLNQVQKPKLKWRLLASKPLLYLRMLALFSTYAQRQLPYRVPGVDSNDVLYASEPEYTEKLQELISSLLGELEAALSALGELAATEANAARALVAILAQWLELAVGTASRASQSSRSAPSCSGSRPKWRPRPMTRHSCATRRPTWHASQSSTAARTSTCPSGCRRRSPSRRPSKGEAPRWATTKAQQSYHRGGRGATQPSAARRVHALLDAVVIGVR